MTVPHGGTTLLGAEGARELIALLSGPDTGAAVLERAAHPDGPAHRLAFRRPAAPREHAASPAPAAPPAPTRTPAPASAPGPVPEEPAAPDEPLLLDRHVLRLAPAPAAPRPGGPAPDLFPSGTALLTNTGQRVSGVEPLPLDDTLEDAVHRVRPRHVRVVVDLHGEDPTPSEALLGLHDALFRTAKACAALPTRPESFVVVVLGGISAARVPHACSGLFTGFAKSLALEWPGTSVLAVVHEARDLVTAEADAARETVTEQSLPVVWHAGGTRLLWQAVVDPGTVTARAAAGGSRPDPGNRTVVAAGGARGIGAALLLALARRDRPRLHIVGSTRPDAEETDAHLERKDFIRARTTGPQRLTVREANMAYDRLGAVREVRENLAALRALCGADRVTYHVCDLRDPEAVRTVVRRITDAEGTVDLLLNIAGTNRAASVDQKRLRDFRTVRDLKVRSYAHLKAAFGDRQPRSWCNFGSFVGFTGQTGETDYGAANDYFNTAALFHSAHGAREFTLGWTLWRDIGLGATPLMRTFLAKSAQFTAMPTAEGVHHFLHELDQPHRPPATVFFGAAERAAIDAAVPGYLDFCRAGEAAGAVPVSGAVPAPGPTAPAPPDFYVDDIVDRAPGRLTVVRAFSQERDAYLHDHVVNGYPTLPGTFVPELAVEAALHLVPGRVPAVIEDVRLESFLRVYRPGRAETKRITARLVHDGPQESVVDVEVTGDVLGPGGRLLVKDRRHFTARVRLRDEPVAPPRWEHWDDHGAEPLADPYHVPNPAVLLSGVFVSTAGTRTHPSGRRARYAPDRPGIERWFSGLAVPSVLLDGLARVCVLDRLELPGAGGGWTPLAVPRTIRRIDLYGGHTDASLAAAGTPVELYSLPARLDLESEQDNRAVAVTAGGDVVLQIKDMTGVVLGHVNQTTGAYRERPRAAANAPEATP
ncbi:SDR family NAD(P)-dependent oxidoreductase [Streptomyces sp. NPDC007904]|jgi:NAD(P)-dependent dehydrogenase (short-subunit alcohol dehydrogenase family)|uniref:SDR family NAD(P)-dependent oxidoreductase n=1 Tax=Streptomyces sp. NPDC007904 TaxID=3364787 RepID=UPI0036E73972